MKRKSTVLITIVLLLLFFASCKNRKKEKAYSLFNKHCASCHILPEINSLPKHIWKDGVLPDMAARMGLIDSTNNPYKRISRREQMAIMESRIYPTVPIINEEDWNLLKEFIVSMAPESLKSNTPYVKPDIVKLFSSSTVKLDSIKGSLITFLEYDTIRKKIITSDLNGKLIVYDYQNNKVVESNNIINALTSYQTKDQVEYHTAVGYLDPSEVPRGSLNIIKDEVNLNSDNYHLHRPVHTLVSDLNNNGNEEVVISEFGNLTGKLSLFYHNGDFNYKKLVLLNLPGCIRTIAKDMNKDGKKDLVVLTTQGRESINIFYQEDNLKFRLETPIKFSPVFGSSWFEIIDYNNDGHDDIVTVHGDNADKSYVHKPYHGLRLHINDGNNNFEEKYFYPLNGATRVVSNDFDQDGDIDFGILSTFPNYEQKPTHSFVYLENKNAEQYSFLPNISEANDLGRWLLMDSGDFDDDGDIDIVLSAFSYSFTPVPKNLHEAWRNSDVDLLILENNLNPAVPNP